MRRRGDLRREHTTTAAAPVARARREGRAHVAVTRMRLQRQATLDFRPHVAREYLECLEREIAAQSSRQRLANAIRRREASAGRLNPFDERVDARTVPH